MKQPLLVTLFTISAVTTFSQIRKGQFLMGGNASFSSTKYGDDSYTSKLNDFQLAHDIGYFTVAHCPRLKIGG